MTEATLARAQAGDGEAFRELVDPYRSELLAHCYRILGSFHDAEDMLQEALLAAWRAIGQFDGRALRAWLYRIATNRCLNYLRGESRRPQPAGLPAQEPDGTAPAWLAYPWWLEPFPEALLGDVLPGPEAVYDARESIALSFVAGLQHLPPQQRAVLVLRDVLGFPAAEAAEILGTTPGGGPQRAHPGRAGLRTNRDIGDVPLPKSAAETAVVDRFVDALEHFDIGRLVDVLTSDARLTMPPEPLEVHGAAADRRLPVRAPALGPGAQDHPHPRQRPARVRLLPARPVRAALAGGSLLVLTLRGNQVCALTRFGDQGLLARFGLPRTLPREGRG